jgi:hypothetical protein
MRHALSRGVARMAAKACAVRTSTSLPSTLTTQMRIGLPRE